MWLCVTVCYLTWCFLSGNYSHSRTASRCCGYMVRNDHRQVLLMFGTHTAVEPIRNRLLGERMKLLWLLRDGHCLIRKHEVVLEDWYLLILFVLCYLMWQGWWIRYRVVLIWEQAIMLLIYIALLVIILRRTVVVCVKTLKRCDQRCCLLLLIHECSFGGLKSVKTCIILLFIWYCGLNSIGCAFWLLLFFRPIDRKHVGINLLLGLILVSCINITLMMNNVSNRCIKRIRRCLG